MIKIELTDKDSQKERTILLIVGIVLIFSALSTGSITIDNVSGYLLEGDNINKHTVELDVFSDVVITILGSNVFSNIYYLDGSVVSPHFNVNVSDSTLERLSSLQHNMYDDLVNARDDQGTFFWGSLGYGLLTVFLFLLGFDFILSTQKPKKEAKN